MEALVQWEYDKRYKNCADDYTERQLNDLGKEGWELAGCYPEISRCSENVVGINYIFKRPKLKEH